METLRALAGWQGGVDEPDDMDIEDKKHNRKALYILVSILVLIVIVVIIVIVISKRQHFVSFETPHGQLSEGCIVNKDGNVIHKIRYGDFKADKEISIAGIPNSGDTIKNDITVPYPDILENSTVPSKREKYVNMNGYQVTDHNTQNFIDPASIIQSSITENQEMMGLQNSTNNIRMIQEKNIDNTL